MSTLYGIQQPGMVPAYSMPFNYEDLQRQMQMAAYYDMMQVQAPLQGRDNLQGTYQTEQKFGRSDASSPVQTTMNQANQGQHHLQQQQAYLNAGNMPPYGYGGLAFYPGGGIMPGGFPTYSAPQMYQVRLVMMVMMVVVVIVTEITITSCIEVIKVTVTYHVPSSVYIYFTWFLTYLMYVVFTANGTQDTW
jgi:hypothetical protein